MKRAHHSLLIALAIAPAAIVATASSALANAPAKGTKVAANSATGVATTAEPVDQVEKDAAKPAEPKRTKAAVSGYIQPQFGMRYRPGAVPRDRTDYSAEDTRAGVIVEGNPIANFGYTLHVTVGGDIVDAVRSPDEGDNDDGVLSRASTGILLERAAVDWDPNQHIGVSVGQMRIPFTVESQISNTKLMFPNRAAANDVFLRGSDLGALARLSVRESKLRVAAGVFNGTDPTSSVEENARGPLYALRADIDPMGPMENGGRDSRGGDVRFGFGAGVVYYPSTTFDSAGFEGPRVRDLRASFSVRAAVNGFYFQGEAMRRQRTDSLSSRPVIATGGYGQASYYVPVKPGVALSPIARLGWTIEDKSFEPRETMWTEAGVSLHLRADQLRADDMRLTLQYLGERRVSERESAHGALAQLQLRW